MFETVTLMDRMSPGVAVVDANEMFSTATSCSAKNIVVVFQLSLRSPSPEMVAVAFRV